MRKTTEEALIEIAGTILGALIAICLFGGLVFIVVSAAKLAWRLF